MNNNKGISIAILIATALVAACGGGGDDAAPPAVAASSTVSASARWSAPVQLESLPGKVEFPSVAMSAGGETIAVYAQRNGERNVVFAVHGNADPMRFGAPRAIDNPSTSAQAPLSFTGKSQSATRVEMNPATGDAIAVWSATSAATPHVWAARYVRSSDAWSAPVQLDTAAGGASYPVVAMNARGDAVAIWSEAASGDLPRSVKLAYYSGTAWTQSIRLSTRATAEAPQAGIDASGTATAAWVEKDAAGNDDIVAARIGSNGIVQAARVLDTSAAPASFPALAVAPNGNALVAWVQSDGSSGSIHASRYAGSWSAPERIESLPHESFAPAAALNDAGGFVAWEQEEAAGFSGRAYAARLNASIRWEEPVMVYNRGGSMPVIRLQDNGDAMMIWLAAHTQYARFSSASSRWSDVTNLSPYNCGNGHAIALDAGSGKAFATWIPSLCGRSEDLWGAVFK